ncbi:MAG: sigma-54 dependent transcriptional regulator [Proteobacteria bacterium]|nr:sigma-54-dependent Fis family transcriptional regulator [Desulfobacula sp.]MBU3954185.1 sigma-54 dependent transcriptional regulator [Pseudomonadota bacterium]MBU4129575.1 sigma-54 dependent transcriptional regulator [Pseudomonadota bacterium]
MTQVVRKILLVDDEERLLSSMAQRLTLLGFEAIKASSGTQAIEIASKTQIDMAIVDLKMPDMDGLMTITRLKEILPDLRTVLLTGYGNKKTQKETQTIGSGYFEKDSMGDLWELIKGLNSNGSDIVIKPSPSDTDFQSKNDYLKALFNSSQIEILSNPKTPVADQQVPRGNVDSIGRSFGDLPKIIGETPGMQRLRKNIERYSGLDCTVIIRGETGTGKELAARAIHTLSHRKGQRFLAFSCGCFSNDFHFKELLSSLEEPELPSVSKIGGTMEKGFVGTILLDHFETMNEQTQQEMMKIIDHTAANPSTDTVAAVMDIRFIVATHEDLNQRVEQGKFNRELYRSLNAIDMELPSLRERRDDISPLCSYFLSKLNKEFRKNIETISDEVLSIFRSYPFPGNVRELKHIIERAVILADTTTIELRHLPERFREKVQGSPLIEDQQFLTLAKMEQQHILKAIKLTKGNKSKAAEVLGISRAALWRKLKQINAGV